jgi:hypothetical protein
MGFADVQKLLHTAEQAEVNRNVILKELREIGINHTWFYVENVPLKVDSRKLLLLQIKYGIITS